MGTTASTSCNVKSISIDQSSSSWTRVKQRRATFFPIHILTRHRSSASLNENRLRSDKVGLLKRAVTAEGKAQDCEAKIRSLERQLRTLELRNHDLSTEVSWLRQKNININEVPTSAPPRVPESTSYFQQSTSKEIISEEPTEDKITELERENQAYKARIEALEQMRRRSEQQEKILGAGRREHWSATRVASSDNSTEENKKMAQDQELLEQILSSDEEDNIEEILNTSIRSNSTNPRTHSGKSRDSGYSFANSVKTEK